ncbi:MAG: FAD-dependent oxidoreductase, partial [Actinomycetota bacterium]|nr:FAD-dependent oxidoreductase [Actinomycetota bacterium]
MGVLPQVVVVGSGFGGLAVARHLTGADVHVTVIDRDNYHGFWPLLYQVATAGLGPDDIARPIRAMHTGAPNLTVRMGTVTGIDLCGRRVHIEDQPDACFDFLVLAAGSSTATFDIPGVAAHAFPLKTLPDAVRLRNHLLSSFEAAAADPTGTNVDAHLTMVLV